MLVKIAFALNLEWKIESVGILINTKSPNESPSLLRVLMLHLKLITPGNSLSNLALANVYFEKCSVICFTSWFSLYLKLFIRKSAKKLIPFLGRVEPICFRVGDIHTKGFPNSSVGKESACRRPWFNSRVGKICWRRDRQPTPVFLGFPCGSEGKETTCYVGDLGVIPWLGRSPGEGKGYSLQCSGLENSMDCIESQRVAKSQTWLRDFHFTSHKEYCLFEQEETWEAIISNPLLIDCKLPEWWITCVRLHRNLAEPGSCSVPV